MERMSIQDAAAHLAELALLVPPGDYVEAIDVALAVMDYSVGSRVECDTCESSGSLYVWPDPDNVPQDVDYMDPSREIACPVCDGYGHADPEEVKATWGEWPTAQNAIARSE